MSNDSQIRPTAAMLEKILYQRLLSRLDGAALDKLIDDEINKVVQNSVRAAVNDVTHSSFGSRDLQDVIRRKIMTRIENGMGGLDAIIESTVPRVVSPALMQNIVDSLAQKVKETYLGSARYRIEEAIWTRLKALIDKEVFAHVDLIGADIIAKLLELGDKR